MTAEQKARAKAVAELRALSASDQAPTSALGQAARCAEHQEKIGASKTLNVGTQ